MKLAVAHRRRAAWRAWAFPPYLGLDQESGAPVGAGADLLEVTCATRMAMEHYLATASWLVKETTREKFSRLACEWKQATEYSSSVTEMSMHPAYQQIIGMGEAALPLLLEELEREPDHWFSALEAITGLNPISVEAAGDVERMAEAWLRWGRVQGYLS